MDGKLYFMECCKSKGLNFEELFQFGKSNAPISKRVQHRFEYLSRRETQIFAICYFERENIYIAWNLKVEKAAQKSVFSVKHTSLDLPLDKKMIAIRKAIEYPSWGEETVLAFTPEGVPDFLEKYCLPSPV